MGSNWLGSHDIKNILWVFLNGSKVSSVLLSSGILFHVMAAMYWKDPTDLHKDDESSTFLLMIICKKNALAYF